MSIVKAVSTHGKTNLIYFLFLFCFHSVSFHLNMVRYSPALKFNLFYRSSNEIEWFCIQRILLEGYYFASNCFRCKPRHSQMPASNWVNVCVHAALFSCALEGGSRDIHPWQKLMTRASVIWLPRQHGYAIEQRSALQEICMFYL